MQRQKNWLTKMPEKQKEEKKTIGIFSLTSCQGCVWMMLDLEKEMLDIVDKFNVLNFSLIKEKNTEGPFDIAFVEGSVTTEEEKSIVKDIRSKSKFLIAYGTCATYGGIPTIVNYMDLKEVEEEIYENPAVIKSIKATGIADHVKVDYFMRGCPVVKEEIVGVVKELLSGRVPREKEYAVCVECREKGNICLLQQGKPCMGPITYAGCNALCPSNSIACYGCRGPLEDANVDMQVKLFAKMGIRMEDITRFFRMFAGSSRIFGKYCDGKNQKVCETIR